MRESRPRAGAKAQKPVKGLGDDGRSGARGGGDQRLFIASDRIFGALVRFRAG